MKKNVDVNTAAYDAAKSKLTVNEYFKLGVEHINSKKYEEAAYCFIKVIALKPNSANAYNNLALAYAFQGKHDLAVCNYKKAIERNPDYAEAYNNLGTTYRSQGHYALAADAYTKAIELKSNYATAYNNRALVYAACGEYGLAAKDFDKAAELGISSARKRKQEIIDKHTELKSNATLTAEEYLEFGKGYAMQNKYALAADAYTKAINLKSNYADAYYNRGIAYYFQDKYELAAKDFDKADELGNPYARLRKQGIINKLRESGKANKLIAVNHFMRGAEHINSKRYKEAADCFTKAIESSPDYADAYYSRSIAYAEQGKYDLSFEDYKKAAALNPEFAKKENSALSKAHLIRGNFYKELGEYELARDCYSTAIIMDPNNAEAYYCLGTYYAALKEYSKSIDNFTKAVTIKPIFDDAYVGRAEVYFNLNQYTKAESDYLKAMKINSNNISAYYNHGIVCSILGNCEQAFTDFDYVLKSDLSNAYLKQTAEKYKKSILDKTDFDITHKNSVYIPLIPQNQNSADTAPRQLITYSDLNIQQNANIPHLNNSNNPNQENVIDPVIIV